MLKFGLFENHLTANPDDYMAVVQNLEIVDEEGIINEMVVPGGVTKTQAAAVLTSWQEAVVKILKSGKGVRIYFADLKPTVRGVFDSEEESFTAGKHAVGINSTGRKVLTEIAKEIKTQKVAVTERMPIPVRFIDTATQRRNEVISSGMVGELKGSLLKCDITDETQGVFIILPDGSDLRCANYIHNTNARLLFYIPQGLPVGEDIELEVRNKVNGSVKDVKKGRFGVSLSVL